LIELIALAGFYHLVSFAANAARVEPEEGAARFPAAEIDRQAQTVGALEG
jgi:hypothetical protein